MSGAGRQGRRPRPGGPYRRVEHAPGDEHPVDLAVEQRLPMRGLMGRIREATGRLAGALGDERQIWLELEELLNARAARREEAYFDHGYEHGLAAGRADALRTIAHAAAPPTGAHAAAHPTGAHPAGAAKTAPASQGAHQTHHSHALADQCRDLAVQAGLPAHLTIIALLETAWALAHGLPERSDSINDGIDD